MQVEIDGNKIQAKDGATLNEIFSDNNITYKKGTTIGIIKKETETSSYLDEFLVTTNKGSFVIKIKDSIEGKLFRKISKQFEKKNVRWKTSTLIAIGSVPTTLTPVKEEQTYNPWDVFFTLAGFDNNTTYLVLSKKIQKGSYGTKNPLGKITQGRYVLPLIEEGDEIISIEPVEVFTVEKDFETIKDLSYNLKGGEKIFTHALIELNQNAPMAMEHIFSLTKSGEIGIDDVTESYILSEGLKGFDVENENSNLRKKNAVSVRTEGKNTGAVYIYKKERITTPNHSVSGMITSGSELIEMLKKGDKLAVKTSPQSLSLLGLTQKEAESRLKAEGIKVERTGDTSDEAIIVEQEPPYAAEVLKNKAAKTLGINKNNIIEIELYEDKAPNTVKYFRKITGLINKPIGKLDIQFAHPTVSLVAFEGGTVEAGGLTPENTPTGLSNRGDVGVTNMSRQHKGLIGVRLKEDKAYGPTGEEFDGTNLIGKIDLDKIKIDLNKEKSIYIKEIIK
ncbi:MAG: methanogenesis marker 3 protein [Candidatus Methanofastidiosum sp.]|nr:methanogenesis marker 3 protein [Methanofastidiosum sp.]